MCNYCCIVLYRCHCDCTFVFTNSSSPDLYSQTVCTYCCIVLYRCHCDCTLVITNSSWPDLYSQTVCTYCCIVLYRCHCDCTFLVITNSSSPDLYSQTVCINRDHHAPGCGMYPVSHNYFLLRGNWCPVQIKRNGQTPTCYPIPQTSASMWSIKCIMHELWHIHQSALGQKNKCYVCGYMTPQKRVGR